MSSVTRLGLVSPQDHSSEGTGMKGRGQKMNVEVIGLVEVREDKTEYFESLNTFPYPFPSFPGSEREGRNRIRKKLERNA